MTWSPAMAALGLAAARWVGFALVAPGWSTVPLPPAARFVWVVWVGALVTPAVAGSALTAPTGWAAWSALALQQAVVGAVMGFVLQAALAAFPAAATLIQNVLGLALFTPAEPALTAADAGLPLLWTLLGAAAFFAAHGPEWLVLAFRASLRAVPLQGVAWTLPWDRLAQVVGQLLWTALVQLAAPALGAALGLYLVAGLLARAYPQLNVYFTMTPLLVGALLLVLALSLPSEAVWAQGFWAHAEHLVGLWMHQWHLAR